MRKRKWLLIVVMILIVINLVFWGMTYLFDVNTYVKNKLTNSLGKQLGATISFSTLNVTTKILQISDLEIHKEGEYTFRATQLYIHYSFWRLVLHNFKIDKALKEVRCFSPEFMYSLDFGAENRDMRIDLQALEETLTRFNYISIINGKATINSKGDITFSDTFDRLNINLQKQNEREWQVSVSAFQQEDKGSLEIEGIYSKDSNHFSIAFNDYKIPEISTRNADLTGAILNAEIETDLSERIDGSVTISNILAEYHDEVFRSDVIDLTLHPDTLFIEDFVLSWRTHEVLCRGSVQDYLRKDTSIDLSLVTNNVKLEEIVPELDGSITIDGHVTGSVFSPNISINFSSPWFAYKDFRFHDFSSDLLYKDNSLQIENSSFFIDTNRVAVSGDISVDQDDPLCSKVNVSALCDNFSYSIKNNYIQTDVSSKISGTLQNPECNVFFDKLDVQNDNFVLADLYAKLYYHDERADFQIYDQSRSVNIEGFADLTDKFPVIEADCVTNDFEFTSLFTKPDPFIGTINPYLNSRIQAKIKNNFLRINGKIDFTDDERSNLKGGVNVSAEVPLTLSLSDGYVNLTSDSLSINDEIIEIALNSTLTKDDQFSANLDVDRIIKANIEGKIIQDDLQYQGRLVIDSLSLVKVRNILSSEDVGLLLDGSVSTNFDFKKSDTLTGKGAIHVHDLTISNTLNPVEINCDIDVLSSKILLKNIKLENSQTLLTGDAQISPDDGNFELNLQNSNVVLTDLFSKDLISGLVNCSIVASGTLRDPRILCDLSIESGSLGNTPFNSFKAQVFQDSTMFFLNELEMSAPDFVLSGFGSYSYNFLTEEFYGLSDELRFFVSGDLLHVLDDYASIIKNASSKTEMMFTIKTEETNTVIDSAYINISDGEFSLKSQPEKIRSFSCDVGIDDNIVKMFEGTLKMGGGRLFFMNEVNEDDTDIFIGDINIGTLILNNDDEGITIHIPKYQPERGLVDVRLVGYASDYFKIFHEDGGWVLSGRILLSNGDAIYEEDEGNEDDMDTGLPPIYADFDLVFDKNTWYVSNPFNLKIDPGDYMSFRSDRETEELELFFDLHSRQGEMRLFGESFSVEDVVVRKARKDDKVFIDATFTKRTPDGSTIYLYVRSTEDKLNADDIGTETYGDVEVILKSDNPNDVTMLSILSKLQYGKEIDDLSEEERFDLGTEQAINLASDELSNLIFSPIISPVEGVIRQILGLDFVRFKTGFMKNIILTSGIVESDDYIADREYDSDLELLGELSKDILLENLAIDLGKYITPEWYLNYEALIKKEMTARNETYIGVQHELSFTWDLPYNFRFIYRYQFYPAQGKDNQGISLETVLHF